MARFEWRTLKVRVNEMTRGKALECSNAFFTYLETVKETENTDDVQARVQREVDCLFVTHAPAVVMVNGVLLTSGVHTLELGDDDTLELELPLTRAAFEALPVSLAAAWSQAAEEANGWLVNHFLASLRIAMASTVEPVPASALSSN